MQHNSCEQKRSSCQMIRVSTCFWETHLMRAARWEDCAYPYLKHWYATHVFFLSPCLCFATLSYYSPFNSMPFIWVPFSCTERSLVNKGRRKAIKMDGFLINRKLKSTETQILLIIGQTQLSASFSLWARRGQCSLISEVWTSLLSLKLGHRKMKPNKELWGCGAASHVYSYLSF